MRRKVGFVVMTNSVDEERRRSSTGMKSDRRGANLLDEGIANTFVSVGPQPVLCVTLC